MSAKDEAGFGGKREPARERSPEEIAAEQIAEAKQTGVAWLSLRGLNLTTWPAALSEFKQLRTLSLGDNQLRKLPSDFGELKQLQELRLDGNHLRELPASLVELSNCNGYISTVTPTSAFRRRCLDLLTTMSLMATRSPLRRRLSSTITSPVSGEADGRWMR